MIRSKRLIRNWIKLLCGYTNGVVRSSLQSGDCIADNPEPDDNFVEPPDSEWRKGIVGAILERLEGRQKWLHRLHGIPSSQDLTNGLPPYPVNTVKTCKPDALVFDDMTPYLRQHMPPFTITIPTHEEAAEQQRRNIEAIDNLELLGNDLLSWQVASKGRTWVKRDASIVRSLYKVSSQCGER
jgi:hypothetical protein